MQYSKANALGRQKAFEKMYVIDDSFCDFNAVYLYALEGTIRDCNWLDIPEKIQRDFKQYAHKLQSCHKKWVQPFTSTIHL